MEGEREEEEEEEEGEEGTHTIQSVQNMTKELTSSLDPRRAVTIIFTITLTHTTTHTSTTCTQVTYHSNAVAINCATETGTMMRGRYLRRLVSLLITHTTYKGGEEQC